MIPVWAKDIVFYYAAVTVLGVLFILRRRPKLGMRLKLRGGRNSATNQFPAEKYASADLGPQREMPENFSHIRPLNERPLNVVFNYNGHSWDAYEVLGLPAGSSAESVEAVYRQLIRTIDVGSRPFMEAAYQAIQTQWRGYKASGDA